MSGDALLAAMVYISEGRAAGVIEQVKSVAASHPPARLLRTFVDKPYNRTGFTICGPPTPLRSSVLAVTSAALTLVDFSQHCGSHPRLGSVDHISVHPLRGTGLKDAAELARDVGEEVAKREEVPVYLYGAASKTGAALESIRRSLGYFKSSQEGQWKETASPQSKDFELLDPDFGPQAANPTRGVLTIGAVPWVVNYNIPITGVDPKSCKRIARRCSQRGGVLPFVQTMALAHEEDLEVACNILDASVTSPLELQEFVEGVAKEEASTATVGKGYFPGLTPQTAIEMYDADGC